MTDGQLFAGSNQPARRSFEIEAVAVGGARVPVRTRDVATTPFYALVEFARMDRDATADALVVAPLSGHYPILMRDVVLDLIPSFRVYVTDWINARYVSVQYGPFGLEANVSSVVEAIRGLRPGSIVVAVCQGGVAALAATAVLGAVNDPQSPAALVLIAAPIDPMANPTRVARLLRSRSSSWLESHVITSVPEGFPGAGRRVYPAHVQLAALWTYLVRRVGEGSGIWGKLAYDDGADPWRFPFLDLYTSIMDLDAAFFVENTKCIYHDRALSEKALWWRGERVDARAVRNTTLLTVEGEWDDVAAPGQTSAAHALCSSLPPRLHRELIVPRCGHFSLFHGDIWRGQVLPAIRELGGFSEGKSAGQSTQKGDLDGDQKAGAAVQRQ